MQVVFRTDASLKIGIGHVMRCLTLADALRTQGATSTFICRQHEGHLIQQIEQHGHDVIALPLTPCFGSDPQHKLAHADWLGVHWTQDARQSCDAIKDRKFDWLVVDHYALDIQWEQALRANYNKLMVIDDLADRAHCCDLLLDQNLGRSSKDYKSLIPPNAKTLIGPRYALLRPEFAQLRTYSLSRRADGRLRNLLITMGGVDKDNVTGKVLNALADSDLPAELQITVVMGQHAPWIEQVKEQAAKLLNPTEVLKGVSNMAQLMANSDLCIGAAGSTTWERCCLGLPTAMIPLAENQKHSAAFLGQMKAVLLLNVNLSMRNYLIEIINEMSSSKARMQQLCACASDVTDGRGSDRVVSRLISQEKTNGR
jgi:UDP-2,4-diacetamido-2,4,6-trideoxy-beta-L-altropyranose hydrolase